jgi:hypothetical protein
MQRIVTRAVTIAAAHERRFVHRMPVPGDPDRRDRFASAEHRDCDPV